MMASHRSSKPTNGRLNVSRPFVGFVLVPACWSVVGTAKLVSGTALLGSDCSRGSFYGPIGLFPA